VICWFKFFALDGRRSTNKLLLTFLLIKICCVVTHVIKGEIRKMNKNNTSTFAALFLMFAMAFSLFALPAVKDVQAIEDWHAYLTASPDPVGVGQRVLIVFGFTLPTRGFGYQYYTDWTLTITDPDEHVQTVTGLDAEATGSTFYVFTPDKVGEWKLKAHYPGGYADFGFNEPFAMNESVPAASNFLTIQGLLFQRNIGSFRFTVRIESGIISRETGCCQDTIRVVSSTGVQ
jgi:hypothetical protein